ncbi:MAG: hypothetical protein IT380_11065 [Myxococcales bacterium]|nr:hypothetical protein [Myxococcales bacterium]
MKRFGVVVGALLLVARGAPAQVTLSASVPVTLTVTTEGQGQARVVGTPSGFVVVWQAGVGRSATVRAARLGLNGASLDPSGFTVAQGTGGRFEPGVTYGHGAAFVVWSDLRDGQYAVYGARVDGSGQVLDLDGLKLSEAPGARMADVVATATGFIVAWAQATPDGQGTEAWARALGADGRPLGPPVVLTTARPWTAGEDFAHRALSRAYAQDVRVAAVGGRVLVAWMGNLGGSQDIRIGRAIIDAATAAVLVPAAYAIPATQSRVSAPAVAAQSDGNVLIAWNDLRNRGNEGLPAHNAALVSVDGPDAGLQQLVALKPNGGAREVLRPAVAPNGTVAFVNRVENPQRNRRVEWRLRVRYVDAMGVSPGEDVTLPEQAAWPALATGPTGVTVLITTTVNGAPGETGRLLSRLVTR